VVEGVLGGVVGEIENPVRAVIDTKPLNSGIEGFVEGAVLGGVVEGVLGGVVGEIENPVRTVIDTKPLNKRIHWVKPVYPEIARQAEIEGSVILQVTIDKKGNVQNLKILRSIPLLDQAAIDAVKQWIYEPFMVDGKPQKAVFPVEVTFKLK
ncbi:MAG: energy transducer TonB, partial [Candidatus Aminicenantaceae bacterium]